MRIVVREDATKMTIIEAWMAIRMVLSGPRHTVRRVDVFQKCGLKPRVVEARNVALEAIL
jgi:hypothetical protein